MRQTATPFATVGPSEEAVGLETETALGEVAGLTATPTSSPSVDGEPAPDLYDLTIIIDPPGAGFIAAIPPFGPYSAGTTVILSVISPRVYPYVFGNWSGDASGSGRTATILVDSNKQVVAHFINPFVTPTPSPTSGQ